MSSSSKLPNHIQKNLDHILQLAKVVGAEQAEAVFQGGEQLSLKAEGGSLGEYKVSQSGVYGVRLFKNSKVATSYCEDARGESLKLMVEQAISSLPHLKERPFETLRSKDRCYQGTEASTQELSQQELNERVRFALDLEQDVLKADPRVQNVPYSGVSEVRSIKAMLNSLGGEAFESHAYASCYTSALMKEGDAQTLYYASHLAHRFNELDSSYCRQESLEKSSLLLQGRPVPSKSYSIVFSPDLLSSLFGCFSKIFSAKSFVEGTNPFREKIGTKIGCDLLTLVDSPNAQEALYPTLFDDEGFATADTYLIEKGIMKGLLHNSATASELQMPHTHNAVRGAKGNLTVGPTHKKIMAGPHQDTEILGQGEVFEVFDMQGLHSGANSTSGDFSFAAAGRLWRDGKLEQVVKHVTVSGNFYNGLKAISMIGDKTYSNASRTFTAPKIRFESFHTAGV